jgi:hypothetical protein
VEPTNLRFGGGAASTTLHPVVALALLISAILIFRLPRKHVVMPSLATMLLVPFGQVVVLGGLHFTVYRIVVIFGLIRLAMTKPPKGASRFAGGFNAIDRAFALSALFSCLVFSLQWMETPALIKSIGNLLDALGGYFVLRFLVGNKEDVQLAIKGLAIVALVLGVCMTNEQFTHENVFGLLGGGTSLATVIRDGKPRSMGPFEVYITAGVFGATLMPLFIWLWSEAKSRTMGCLGIIGATAITFTSNSSTPLLAYVAGLVGLCFWPLRRRMRVFRWVLVLILVALHLAMKAPVWALIARIDLTGSSSGNHRYMLVDNTIRHFSDWWLLGVKDYDSWGYDMWDLSNQYVAYGVTGGLVTLVFFVATISRSFGKLGAARKYVSGEPKYEWRLWCLGAALFAHVVAYFGIGYFDQMQVAWYALLAIISVAVSEVTSVQQIEEQEVFASVNTVNEPMKWRVLEADH